uniref:hypothetical protein n=1 Tax=Phytobacter massiliensis TaxID=1485952 RepID=UPI0002D6BC0B
MGLLAAALPPADLPLRVNNSPLFHLFFNISWFTTPFLKGLFLEPLDAGQGILFKISLRRHEGIFWKYNGK